MQYPCQGNSAQICGGANRLNVYAYFANTCMTSTTATTTATTTTASASATCTGPSSWVALGCYTDIVAERSLQVRSFVDNPTNEKCQAACLAKGYNLAGTEYFGECYCDVTLRFGSTLASDQTSCNTPCSGNTTEICGGGNRLSLFSYQPSCPSPSTTTTTTTSACTATATSFVNQTNCNGQVYTYQQLAGYGFNPSNATDKFGDTIGGIGSAIALDRTAWTKLANGSYTGVLYALPDRGW